MPFWACLTIEREINFFFFYLMFAQQFLAYSRHALKCLFNMWNSLHQENVSNIILKCNINEHWGFRTISFTSPGSCSQVQATLFIYYEISHSIHIYFYLFYNLFLTRFLVLGAKWKIGTMLHLI